MKNTKNILIKFLPLLFTVALLGIFFAYTTRINNQLTQLESIRKAGYEQMDSTIQVLNEEVKQMHADHLKWLGDTAKNITVLHLNQKKLSSDINCTVSKSDNSAVDVSVLYGTDTLNHFKSYDAFLRFIDSISYSTFWYPKKDHSSVENVIDTIPVRITRFKPLHLFKKGQDKLGTFNTATIEEVSNGVLVEGNYHFPPNTQGKNQKISFAITYIATGGITNIVSHFELEVSNSNGNFISEQSVNKVGKGIYILMAYYNGYAVSRSILEVR